MTGRNEGYSWVCESYSWETIWFRDRIEFVEITLTEWIPLECVSAGWDSGSYLGTSDFVFLDLSPDPAPTLDVLCNNIELRHARGLVFFPRLVSEALGCKMAGPWPPNRRTSKATGENGTRAAVPPVVTARASYASRDGERPALHRPSVHAMRRM